MRVAAHAATESYARHVQRPPLCVRRRPDKTVLHRVVREYLETLVAESAARSATGRGHPAQVKVVSRRYLACGILAKGCLRVHCDACQQDEVVAFGYKGRGLCPSCIVRRISDLSARLIDERLPYPLAIFAASVSA